jgi:hypothetical protein
MRNSTKVRETKNHEPPFFHGLNTKAFALIFALFYYPEKNNSNTEKTAQVYFVVDFKFLPSPTKKILSVQVVRTFTMRKPSRRRQIWRRA